MQSFLQENEKLHSVLCGRAGLDSLGLSSGGHSKITLASSMEMLQSLPDSVRGCLMEAARLCAPPAVKPKPEVSPLPQDHQTGTLIDSTSLGANVLAGINLDHSSLQALQRISGGMKSSDVPLVHNNKPMQDDKNDIFASILSADFLGQSDDCLTNDFLNGATQQMTKDSAGASSSESEQWNIQGMETILSALSAPSCY